MMSRRSHWPIVILSTIATLFGVFLPLILVRVLTPEEVGKFKIFFLYLTILPAFSLTVGIINGLAYWVGQEQKGTRAIKMSSTLLLLLGIIAVLLALTIRKYIASSFGWNDEQARIFSFALLGTIAGSFFEEAAIATGKTWTGGLFYSGFELLRTGSILIALFLYRDLTALLWASTIVVTLKVFTGYIYGTYLNLVGFVYDRASLKAVWKYAFPVSLAWVFGIFVGSADQFVLASTIQSSQFAIYSIGCLTIAPLLIYEHSITRVLIPQMSEAFSQRQPSKAAILYQSAVENLSFILVPAVVGLIVFATPIIEICFTKQYSTAAKYLQLYALTYLFLIIPYDALPRSRGQSNWILKTFIIFSVISLALAILLASWAGPVGALSAILISGAAMRLYAIFYFKTQTHLKLRKFLPISSFLKYFFISFALAFIALVLHSEFRDEHSWFFILAPAFAVFYLFIALPIKTRSERLRQPLRGLLMLTQSLNIGGLERMVLHLCVNIQAQKQWSVHVLAYDQITPDSQSLLTEFESKNIPVEAFKKSRGFSLLAVVRILRNIYRNDIQIIHSQDLGSLLYATIAKLCCFGRISIVHTQHSFIHLLRARRYRFYEKILTGFVDKLSVVSDDTRKTYLELGVAEGKIYLIENGVEFSKTAVVGRKDKFILREQLIKESQQLLDSGLMTHLEDYWILYVARFFPGKGQEHALELWNQINPELRQRSALCFIGPESAEGQYNRVTSLIEQAPDADRIYMLGASNSPQSWLNVGDLYLSCSEFEGMPLGPLEAVGSGLPTLVSNIPGHDFIKDLSSQFPLNDKKKGARHIEAMLSRLSDEGDSYFQSIWNKSSALRQNYSIERMSRKYSLLYADSSTAKTTSFLELGESYG